MNKTLLNKIKIYTKQGKEKRLENKYIIKDDGSILFANKYSIIKLFDTTYNKKNRNDILATLEKSKLNTIIIKHYNNFENNGFNIPAPEKTLDENYNFYGENNLSFDKKLINQIKKIIAPNGNVSTFESETERNAICFVGKNGIAFLLGCCRY